MSHTLDFLGDSENLGNWGKLNPLQEKARAIDDLERRLEWLEKTLKREQMAWDASQKLENIKALYETAQRLRSYAPNNGMKKFDEAIEEEITRTKELLRLKEIRDAAEAKPDIEAALFYLIDRKSEYHYPVKFTYFSEREYLKYIEQCINEMKQQAVDSTPPNKGKQLKWKGSQIELITLFYDMLGCEMIEAHKTDIAKMLATSFIDKDGQTLSYEYIYKHLKPDTEKSSNKADFSAFG